MKTIVPKTFSNKIVLSLLCFGFFLATSQLANAQVSITTTSPITESFTGFTANGALTVVPTNWNILGTGTRGTTWNDTAETTNTNGGWYGNNNMSFLGTNAASSGNATWLLQNNSGYTITGFNLSFHATMWKNGSKSPTVSVSYTDSILNTIPTQGGLKNPLTGLSFSDATTNIFYTLGGADLLQTVSNIAIPSGNYIYIRFINAGGTNGDNLGWDNVTFTPVIPTVNIAGISPSASNIYPASTNNILQSYSINPLFSAVTLSSLTVTTGGTYTTSDLAATTPFKLYYNTTNSLTGATLLSSQSAVTSGNAVSFTGLGQSFSAGATRYLLVTADISSTATLGNTINISTTSFSNISFSVVPQKAGTDPVAAGNTQTIYAGLALSNSGSPSATNIARGTTDNVLFGFDITPAGTTSSINLTSVTFTAMGSVVSTDMNNFKIVKDVDSSGDYSGGDIIISSSLPYSSTMSFSLNAQTGITSHTKYLLLADVLANADTTHSITISINANSDVATNADITSAATYSGYSQSIVNPITTSASTDYYRSVATNGNWTSTSTWQSSNDNVTWHAATLIPTNSSGKGIVIKSGTIVTIDSNVTARILSVETGGTLKHTAGKTLTMGSTTAAFKISGTYILYGTRPSVNASASVVVNSGGVVEVDDNTGGQSDDFARQTNVEFKTGSVFYWNTTLAFETDNVTYFQGPNYATDMPIFRVSQPVSVGSTNPTTINGKFESYGSNPQFKYSGIKTFRDGFGGMTISGAQAKITHATNSGPFKITGTNAVIDGTVILNIDNSPVAGNDLEVSEGAYLTISGSPTINIGNSGATGSDFAIEGTLKHTGSLPVYLTYGNLIVDGFIDAASTGTFQANNSTATITNISVGNNTTSGSSFAGTLTFTSGYNYVTTFKMNKTVSRSNASIALGSDVITNTLTLTNGIVATGNHLFTYNNLGSLTLPSSYNDSYICTCNTSGVEITPTGSTGFRINNVSGALDQMFPVGTNFNSANRMAVNMNNSTTDNFTVVVGIGDIGNTPLPRVNRIWYVSEGTSGGSTATMKLYFTKRDWNTYAFGSANNDEIENGFLWSDPHLVQENYSNYFMNVATTGTTDVPDLTSNTTYPYNTEVFGLYTKGISVDTTGVMNGITAFTRFSVVNAESVILPASITNVKAYQKGNGIQVDWTALNEINMKQYEVQRSADGIVFNTVATVVAVNNGASLNNYSATDAQPLSGNNFYRIKAVDKNGAVKYTAIVKVAITNGVPSITIQPNPVVNRSINLALNNIAAGKYNFAVYNMLGQKIISQSLTHAGGSASQLVTLPASAKAGTYVVKLFNETTNFSVRILVQ